MIPMIRELELSQTFIWSPSAKEADYAERMGLIYAKLICAYETSSNPQVFDQYKILIADLWQQQSTANPKHELIYRIEKILMLYECWFRTNKWTSPLVAATTGDCYRVHPGKDRWHIMNHLNVPRHQFVVIDKVDYQTLVLIADFWQDKKTLSIKGKVVPAIFHDYDKTDVYKFSRIDSWIRSNMPFKEFAAATPRQRSMNSLINKKGP